MDFHSFFSAHFWAFIVGFCLLWAVAGYFDQQSTKTVLHRGGVELNPVMQWLMKVSPNYWPWWKLAGMYASLPLIFWGVGSYYGQFSVFVVMVLMTALYIYVIMQNYRSLQ